MEGAWTRRPATAVSRLSGRPLLLLSARDLPAARDAALVASHVCQLELGLEIVPLLERLQGWADERGATLEQAAARHQRVLRKLPPADQEKLEALCGFEALELHARAGAAKTAPAVLQRIAALAQKE
ncbi:MAG TPA: hypothetical protein VKH65_00435 [Myxococcales bacterium]|nr:hypothetical protein [Myxococcales bacterium]